MLDALTIRPATPYDAQAIARIRVQGWRFAYQGLISQDYPRFAQRRQRHQADARVPQPVSPELAAQQVSTRAKFGR